MYVRRVVFDLCTAALEEWIAAGMTAFMIPLITAAGRETRSARGQQTILQLRLFFLLQAAGKAMA